MRKTIIFVVVYVLFCLLVPYILTMGTKVKEPIKISKYSDIKNIRLLITDKNEVIEMSFNDYLMGVLIGEVPATYEMEALKAQAVVARTYTVHKLAYASGSHNNADMCDDINHCQAYKSKEYAFMCWDDDEEKEKWKKIEDSVNSTSGEIVTYNGEIINAFFHAHSGGKTEDVKFIWNRESIPYLKSVESAEGYDFNETKAFSKEDFIKIMKGKYSKFNNDCTISIISKTVSERIDKLKIGNIEMLGTEARTLFGLRSTCFEFSYANEQVIFKTTGYGHGIGMSQEGANYMAQNGSSYIEIIKHYYTNVEVEKMAN